MSPVIPKPNKIRYRVDPADVPEDKAARRLYLSIEEFKEKLPSLIARGFPPPDPDTGMFDLDAIDRWRKLRNPHLFGLTPLPPATETKKPSTSMGERFNATKNRVRNGSAS